MRGILSLTCRRAACIGLLTVSCVGTVVIDIPASADELESAEQVAAYRAAAVRILGERRPPLDQVLDLAKRTLANGDALEAYGQFLTALQINPSNAEANFYLAVTRLLTWLPHHQRDFVALGFTGLKGAPLSVANLNVFHLDLVPPTVIRVPSQFSRGGQVQAILLSDVLGTLQRSQANLALVGPTFSSTLPIHNPLTGGNGIEIDGTDVWLCRAALRLGSAFVYLSQVYNLDARVQDIVDRTVSHGWGHPSAFLDRAPRFLQLQSVTAAGQARRELITAIDAYLSADTALRQETDDQSDDLFTFARLPEDLRRQELFRKALTDIRQSLLSLSDPGWNFALHQFVDLGAFFNRPIDVRALETGAGVQSMLNKTLLPQLQRALTQLQKAPVTFSYQLDPDTARLFHRRAVEIDYGDLVALQALLESGQAAIALLSGYDVNVRLPRVLEDGAHHALNVPRDLIGKYPGFLRLRDAYQVRQATAAFGRSVDLALQASDYLHTSDDPNQEDDLIPLQGWFAVREAFWRPQLEALHASMDALIDPDPGRTGDEFRVNVNALTNRPPQVRDLLPAFQGQHAVFETMPDPTLGDFLPGFTVEEWQRRFQ